MWGAWRQLFWKGEAADLTKVEPSHWLGGEFVHLKTLGWDNLRVVKEIRRQFSIFFFLKKKKNISYIIKKLDRGTTFQNNLLE